MTDRIRALARRVADDPFFLGCALAEYAGSEGLDERALAELLGCSISTLAPLALCRRPRPQPPFFRQDVERIAERFGLKADVLAALVRRADAIASLRQARASGGQPRDVLAAARDRETVDAGDQTGSDAEEGER